MRAPACMRVRHLRGCVVGFSFMVALTAHAATINVSTTADVIDPTDGHCSLREAVIAANTDAASGPAPGECRAGSGVDTIVIASGTYVLSIPRTGVDDATTGNLNLDESSILVGIGNPVVTAIPGWDDNIFATATGTTVSMHGFTVSGGHLVLFGENTGGGGIRAGGALTLREMTIAGNTIVDLVGLGGVGGGVMAIGPLTLVDSTLSGNATQFWGSALYSQDNVTIRGSTIIDNTGHYGAAFLYLVTNGATATIVNSTIADNVASLPGPAGLQIQGLPDVAASALLQNVTISGNAAEFIGAFSVVGNALTVVMENTLIAGNSGTWPDCPITFTAVVSSNGNNLIGNNAGCALSNIQPSDRIGTPASPIDPLLGAPANNGGPTQTLALLPGSPAIDTGGTTNCAAIDQRGFARPEGSSCDIGAFEFGASAGTTASALPVPALGDPLLATMAALLAVGGSLAAARRRG